MVMCSKCHKRVAVVFVTKLENGNKVSEGLCITCAKELGVPVLNLQEKLGIDPNNEEQREKLTTDGLHFNDEGHAYIAAALGKFLTEL